MPNLDNLIYDRTQADLTNDTDKAYIAYTDLNRIEGACAELAEILGVTIQTKTWAIDEYRTVSEMQRLSNNIKALQDAYYRMPGTPTAPNLIEYQSITEANNVERILADIYELYKNVRAGLRSLSFRLSTSPIGNREV